MIIYGKITVGLFSPLLYNADLVDIKKIQTRKEELIKKMDLRNDLLKPERKVKISSGKVCTVLAEDMKGYFDHQIEFSINDVETCIDKNSVPDEGGESIVYKIIKSGKFNGKVIKRPFALKVKKYFTGENAYLNPSRYHEAIYIEYLKDFTNVVKLFCRWWDPEKKQLYIVFEHEPMNLQRFCDRVHEHAHEQALRNQNYTGNITNNDHDFKLKEGFLRSLCYQLVTSISLIWKRFNIVHCDIKPSNILINKGRFKLCDYGVAVMVSDTNFKPSRPTNGTAYCMPGELRNEEVCTEEQLRERSYSAVQTITSIITIVPNTGNSSRKSPSQTELPQSWPNNSVFKDLTYPEGQKVDVYCVAFTVLAIILNTHGWDLKEILKDLDNELPTMEYITSNKSNKNIKIKPSVKSVIPNQSHGRKGYSEAFNTFFINCITQNINEQTGRSLRWNWDQVLQSQFMRDASDNSTAARDEKECTDLFDRITKIPEIRNGITNKDSFISTDDAYDYDDTFLENDDKCNLALGYFNDLFDDENDTNYKNCKFYFSRLLNDLASGRSDNFVSVDSSSKKFNNFEMTDDEMTNNTEFKFISNNDYDSLTIDEPYGPGYGGNKNYQTILLRFNPKWINESLFHMSQAHDSEVSTYNGTKTISKILKFYQKLQLTIINICKKYQPEKLFICCNEISDTDHDHMRQLIKDVYKNLQVLLESIESSDCGDIKGAVLEKWNHSSLIRVGSLRVSEKISPRVYNPNEYEDDYMEENFADFFEFNKNH